MAAPAQARPMPSSMTAVCVSSLPMQDSTTTATPMAKVTALKMTEMISRIHPDSFDYFAIVAAVYDQYSTKTSRLLIVAFYIGMCLFYRFFYRMESVFLIDPCDVVFFIHTRSLLFTKRYLSFGSLLFENEAAMPGRTQPRCSANRKLSHKRVGIELSISFSLYPKTFNIPCAKIPK